MIARFGYRCFCSISSTSAGLFNVFNVVRVELFNMINQVFCITTVRKSCWTQFINDFLLSTIVPSDSVWNPKNYLLFTFGWANKFGCSLLTVDSVSVFFSDNNIRRIFTLRFARTCRHSWLTRNSKELWVTELNDVTPGIVDYKLR